MPLTGRAVLLPLLLFCAADSASARDARPHVAAVDLGQSGIVHYTLTYRAEGRSNVRLTVPLEHADDVLASLLVRDLPEASSG